jgi:hypothetical protein
MGEVHVHMALCLENNKIPPPARNREHIAYPETPSRKTRALILFSRLSMHLMYTLQKLSPPSNHREIFMVKICINFTDPTNNVTMAPDSASSLSAHLSTYELILAEYYPRTFFPKIQWHLMVVY